MMAGSGGQKKERKRNAFHKKKNCQGWKVKVISIVRDPKRVYF